MAEPNDQNNHNIASESSDSVVNLDEFCKNFTFPVSSILLLFFNKCIYYSEIKHCLCGTADVRLYFNVVDLWLYFSKLKASDCLKVSFV